MLKQIQGFQEYENLFCIDESVRKTNPTGTFKDRQPQALREYLPSAFPQRRIVVGSMSTGNTAYSLIHFSREFNQEQGEELVVPVIFIPEGLGGRAWFGPDTTGRRVSGEKYVDVLKRGSTVIPLDFGNANRRSKYLSSLVLGQEAYKRGTVKKGDLFLNITEGLEFARVISREQIELSLEGRFTEREYEFLPVLGIRAYEPIIREGLARLETQGRVPAYIICQFGAGVLYNETAAFLRRNDMKTSVIAIAAPDAESCADKIYPSYWVKDVNELREGRTTSRHDGSFVYAAEDEEVRDALKTLSWLDAEPSGIAGFGVLHRLESIVGDLDRKKDVVVTINTGNGIPNFV